MWKQKIWQEVIERFEQQAPGAVTAHLALDQALPASWIDEVFQAHRQRQYPRELLFSSVVELMLLVTLGLRPSLHAAARKMADRLTMREIQGFLLESYGVEVSPEFISSVTDAVMAEVTAWQARPLEPMYPVVFFDALRVKIKEDAVVRNKAIYLALGVLPDGTRDILGLWIEGTEGAKFWMKVFNDLKTRGVNDILIAVTDGLKGMPEALAAVYPATTLRTCIVHLIRNSLDYASWKDRKLLAAAIRPIYTAASAEAAEAELDAFAQGPWGVKFPTVVAAWRRAWDRVIPFFAFPPSIRRVIYTTNAIESINARLRKIIKTRGHFPSDDAASKLIWLALRNITADWGRAAKDWKEAMNQFAILHEDRFTQPTHGASKQGG